MNRIAIYSCIAVTALTFTIGAQSMNIQVDVSTDESSGANVETEVSQNSNVDFSEVIGTFEATHPHWKDKVIIAADGRYKRGSGDPGSWTYDGTTLSLNWDNWKPEKLVKMGNGVFNDNEKNFKIVKVGGSKPVIKAVEILSSKHFKLQKRTFAVGDAITVDCFGMPGNSGQWITFVKKTDKTDTWGNWTYVTDTGMTFEVSADEPGEYEMRAYYGGAGDYTVRDRFAITVK